VAAGYNAVDPKGVNVSLHTDIPSRAQIERLMTSRDPSSVSVYLPTDPASAAFSPAAFSPAAFSPAAFSPAAFSPAAFSRSLWTVYLLWRKKPSKVTRAEFENRSFTVPNSLLKVPSSWPVSIKSPAGRSPLAGSRSPKR
jgi:hypothetical protein